MTVEHMMYFALGFLIATILAVIVLPSVWKRAVRLTRKRIEAATPITMAEFRADKDQLRAQFALTQRRLERNIESLRERLTEQLAELNTTRTELALARSERQRALEVQAELEERNTAATSRIHDLERQVAGLSQRLRASEREILDLTMAQEERQAVEFAPAAEPAPTGEPRRGALDSLRSALTLGDRETLEALESINDAYSRISRAGSSLDALLDESSHNGTNGAEVKPSSLAEELSQEEALEDLHNRISGVETRIEKDWDSETVDKDGLRNELGEIATSVSKLIYADDSGEEEEQESLFDRIRKYAGDSLEDDAAQPSQPRPKPAKKLHAFTGTTVSDRISAFRDIHANS